MLVITELACPVCNDLSDFNIASCKEHSASRLRIQGTWFIGTRSKKMSQVPHRIQKHENIKKLISLLLCLKKSMPQGVHFHAGDATATGSANPRYDVQCSTLSVTLPQNDMHTNHHNAQQRPPKTASVCMLRYPTAAGNLPPVHSLFCFL